VRKPRARWLSLNHSKRKGETFFLVWSVVWVTFFGWIVLSGVFERFTSTTYMLVGVVVGLPPIIYPLLFPVGDDAKIPWYDRYTTKANVWIFTMAWIGNYFWTHYFYRILGAVYTFEAWRLNDVPFCLFLISHSYFLLYHTLSNLLLRRLWACFPNPSALAYAVVGTFVVVFAYFIAFMEVFTIQNFPYYSYPDKQAMWVVGSGFYAIYFIVSFPMFFRLDEEPSTKWSLKRTFLDACAACMIVTQVLDAWRLSIGPIYAPTTSTAAGAASSVSFVH